METIRDGKKDTRGEESNQTGAQGKEKGMEKEMTGEREKGKCKDLQKDRQGKPYSMGLATTAKCQDTQQRPVRRWEKDSKETATHVD